MTPFYLFFGVLIVYIFQAQINLKKLNGFISVFLILFIFSPFAYAYISITETDKRTDYPGKKIAKKVQDLYDKRTDKNRMERVSGDEWVAGNLSYHLQDRPKWEQPFIGKVINTDEKIFLGEIIIWSKEKPTIMFIPKDLLKYEKN